MDVTYDFSNKVVLIAGGTGALGTTLVKKFIDAGAKAISTYLNEKEAERLKTTNDKVELMKLDITKEEEILKVIPKVIEKYGRINVLVNLVGGYSGGKSITEMEKIIGTQ